jgi:hypothetical protein
LFTMRTTLWPVRNAVAKPPFEKPSAQEAHMTDRERIEPNPGDKRYVRRDEDGQFTKDQTDVGKSAAADQRRRSDTPAKRGQGDRGDRQG